MFLFWFEILHSLDQEGMLMSIFAMVSIPCSMLWLTKKELDRLSWFVLVLLSPVNFYIMFSVTWNSHNFKFYWCICLLLSLEVNVAIIILFHKVPGYVILEGASQWFYKTTFKWNVSIVLGLKEHTKSSHICKEKV